MMPELSDWYLRNLSFWRVLLQSKDELDLFVQIELRATRRRRTKGCFVTEARIMSLCPYTVFHRLVLLVMVFKGE